MTDDQLRAIRERAEAQMLDDGEAEDLTLHLWEAHRPHRCFESIDDLREAINEWRTAWAVTDKASPMPALLEEVARLEGERKALYDAWATQGFDYIGLQQYVALTSLCDWQTSPQDPDCAAKGKPPCVTCRCRLAAASGQYHREHFGLGVLRQRVVNAVDGTQDGMTVKQQVLDLLSALAGDAEKGVGDAA